MSNQKITTLNPQERLDRLAKRAYGTEKNGTVEALLDANPGLALEGFILVGPRKLNSPDVDTEPKDEIQRPWE